MYPFPDVPHPSFPDFDLSSPTIAAPAFQAGYVRKKLQWTAREARLWLATGCEKTR
jgi:hypothetical protein